MLDSGGSLTATTFANDCKGIDEAGEGDPSKKPVYGNDITDSTAEEDVEDDDLYRSTENRRRTMMDIEASKIDQQTDGETFQLLRFSDIDLFELQLGIALLYILYITFKYLLVLRIKPPDLSILREELAICCVHKCVDICNLGSWNKNRMLLAATLSTFVVSSKFTHHTKASSKYISQTVLVASLIIDFTASVLTEYATSAIPGITGCYNSSTSFQLSVQYLLLSVFQLRLMILTLICAIQSWRINSNRLFQVMMLAILATHMHLRLWQMNQHAYRPDALARIPISDVSSVNSTV
ncbi:hypothetical protein BD769DRAFT_1393436 [Suillus cothurnatus]|nr:hypothetical protein BD769DRAFT_1393436 [Suillus cothurnatus]